MQILDEHRILFLDFDGVLNTLEHWVNCNPKEQSDLLQPILVQRLSKFLSDHPNVLIVLSTAWRCNWTIEELKGFLAKNGFEHPTRIIGVTPIAKANNFFRGLEIAQWCAENKIDFKKIVIFDDMHKDQFPGVQDRFIEVDAEFGFQHHHWDKAKKLWNI